MSDKPTYTHVYQTYFQQLLYLECTHYVILKQNTVFKNVRKMCF